MTNIKSDISDPRINLISNIDIAKCRVEFTGPSVVLLCGGLVPVKQNADDTNPVTASLRHAIVNNFQTNVEVFRPEEIDNWHMDGLFKNLVSFELELAAICTMVVIIPESAGSLVELGAFSQIPELSKKSIVICSDKYNRDNSFIQLGILRFITTEDNSRVKTYTWNPDCTSCISPTVVSDVIKDIETVLEELPKSQVLKVTERSHSYVVICELLNLFGALKDTDILDYLVTLKFELTKDDLKRKLFLLQSFQLIIIRKYSDSTFYMSSGSDTHKLRLKINGDEKPIDSLRIKSQCLKFYKDNPSKFRNCIRVLDQSRQTR